VVTKKKVKSLVGTWNPYDTWVRRVK